MRAVSPTETLADWGELRFLNWVRRTLALPRADASSRGRGARRGSAVRLSIGDDAAIIGLKGASELVTTTDALIEGVHFRHAWTSPRDLGVKSLAASLSDLAAMGARPIACLVSLGVPGSAPIRTLKSFFKGLHSCAMQFDCPIAGGDLVGAPQWTISLTVMGVPQKSGARLARRSDAQSGQLVYVTGAPGESAAGLHALARGDRQSKLIARHNLPTPRLAEAAALVKVCPDLAMIDISDGLAGDAAHLASESRVRIEIDEALTPFSAPLARYAIKCRPCRGAPRSELIRDWLLHGGEDYELLFTTRTPEVRIRREFGSRGIETRLTCIGRVEAGRGVFLTSLDGNRAELVPKAFDHFGGAKRSR